MTLSVCRLSDFTPAAKQYLISSIVGQIPTELRDSQVVFFLIETCGKRRGSSSTVRDPVAGPALRER